MFIPVSRRRRAPSRSELSFVYTQHPWRVELCETVFETFCVGINSSNRRSAPPMKPGYKQTEVGVIPEDWEVAVLESLAERGSGHTPNKSHVEYWNGNIKWISLKDTAALDRGYIRDTVAKITEQGLANSSARLHQADTVILLRDAGVGKSAVMAESMAVSQHFIVWRCGESLFTWYLY